jgi:hypothetical protein
MKALDYFVYVGGHTSEMLKLIKDIPDHYCPRHYIVGEDDHLSFSKLEEYEHARGSNLEQDVNYIYI